jgi:hypothetical protein
MSKEKYGGETVPSKRRKASLGRSKKENREPRNWHLLDPFPVDPCFQFLEHNHVSECNIKSTTCSRSGFGNQEFLQW